MPNTANALLENNLSIWFSKDVLRYMAPVMVEADGILEPADKTPRKHGTKRRYDTTQALRTRELNRALEKSGYEKKSHYTARAGNANKRPYVRSGKFRGATVKKGGCTRTFSSNNSKFYKDDGT